MISAIASDSLGGAILLLVVGGVATLLTKAVTGLVLAVRARREHLEKCRQILVDVVIHTRFLDENVRNRVSADNIAATKEMINRIPKTYRAYVLVSPETLFFADWHRHRHSFTARRFAMTNADIGLVDAYIAQAQLYFAYYEALGSDRFVELSRERKVAVLDNLQIIGRDALKLRDRVLQIRCIDRLDTEVPRLFT